MTIREMTILLEVAKYNNMSAASRTLYISQSTVSQTILDIEKAYNVKLFERLSKKTRHYGTGKNIHRLQ
ncbi:MAG: LysR family transcriptional regulator [[Clostridium] symbiosum]